MPANCSNDFSRSEERLYGIMMKHTKNSGGAKLPPIVEKHYEFCAWLIEKVGKFPKDQRFLLGDRIERHALDILEMLIEASLTSSRDGKAEILRGANVRLEHLRYMMRLAKDGKFININSFHFACERMEEIGRMIGGWIKSRQVYEKSGIKD